MKERRSMPALDIDDDTGRAWAAELQKTYGPLALVQWEVGGRHLTAFWLGPAPEPVWVKAPTPQALRDGVAARLGELRLTTEAGTLLPIPHQSFGGFHEGGDR